MRILKLYSAVKTNISLECFPILGRLRNNTVVNWIGQLSIKMLFDVFWLGKLQLKEYGFNTKIEVETLLIKIFFQTLKITTFLNLI